METKGETALALYRGEQALINKMMAFDYETSDFLSATYCIISSIVFGYRIFLYYLYVL